MPRTPSQISGLVRGASSLLRVPALTPASSATLVHSRHRNFTAAASNGPSDVLAAEIRRRNVPTGRQTPPRSVLSSSASSSSAPPPRSQSRTATSSSVSSDEVTKFSSLADTWWDAARNPLIGMNPVRVSYIVDALRSHGVVVAPPVSSAGGGGVGGAGGGDGATTRHRPLAGLRALDVGCGGGLLSESLARLGAEVTAVDPSVEVANAAREHSSHDALTATIDYRGGTSVEDLAEEVDSSSDVNAPKLFDVICILEVVEHATDPRSLLDAAARLLKPGGMIFVSTLNRTAKSYVVAILGGEYVMRYLPVGTHSWEKFLSPEEVQVMMDGVGCEVVDVSGMIVRPPFVDMRWKLDRTDTDVNWIGAYRRKRV